MIFADQAVAAIGATVSRGLSVTAGWKEAVLWAWQ